MVLWGGSKLSFEHILLSTALLFFSGYTDPVNSAPDTTLVTRTAEFAASGDTAQSVPKRGEWEGKGKKEKEKKEKQ